MVPRSLPVRLSVRTCLSVGLCLVLVLLSGCFDYRERITVRPDGSALVEVEILIDSLAVAASGGPEGLKERIAGLMGPLPAGVSFQSYETTFEDHEAIVSFSLLAESIQALLALSETLGQEGSLLAGQTVELEFSGAGGRLQRVLGPGMFASGSPAARGLGAAMSQGHTWRFELSVPGYLRTTTADQVLPDGTLLWEVPMTELGGTVLSAEYSAFPVSGSKLAMLLMGLLCLGVLVRQRPWARSESPQ